MRLSFESVTWVAVMESALYFTTFATEYAALRIEHCEDGTAGISKGTILRVQMAVVA